MNVKIVMLLLCLSLALFGCAGRAREAGQQDDGGAAVTGLEGNMTAADQQELAGLFNIDTDKPLGEEGYGTQTPSQN